MVVGVLHRSTFRLNLDTTISYRYASSNISSNVNPADPYCLSPFPSLCGINTCRRRKKNTPKRDL